VNHLPSVPNNYLGVWQRTLLRNADGTEDSCTRVFWLQTNNLHADIRIPNPTPNSLEQRLKIVGFAGITSATLNRCEWRRLIDFHTDSGSDIGNMHFVSPDEVQETALDDSYLEVWKRLPDSTGTSAQIWLKALDPSRRQACLLRAGDYFMFAAERPIALTHGPSLEHYLSYLENKGAEQILGCELTLGRITGGHLPWEVLFSTQPNAPKQLLEETIANVEDWFALPFQHMGSYPPKGGWQIAPLPSKNDK
jgi:hypothetical protein